MALRCSLPGPSGANDLAGGPDCPHGSYIMHQPGTGLRMTSEDISAQILVFHQVTEVPVHVVEIDADSLAIPVCGLE